MISKQTPAGQYRTPSNLQTRINLYRLFNVNPYGWHRWVFDQFDLGPRARLLEIGCGPGDLWSECRDRVPPGWHITLSDASTGMLGESRRGLAAAGATFTYLASDAEAIALAQGHFDALVASHMLYHVIDKPRAFSEIWRVLTGGVFTITKDTGSLVAQ